LAHAPTDVADYAPLGFGYLAAFLRRHDIAAKCSVERHLEDLLTIGPDVIGLSCSSQNYGAAVAAARLLRQRTRARIVLGGPHISLLPESLDPAFDCGVVGEGEDTFLHLMRVWEETGALSPEHLAAVPGVVFWRDRQLVRTDERPPIDPLDEVPAPDRTILPATRFVHVMTGRGCPRNCRFCAARAMWGPHRSFSARRVADELLELIGAGYRRIHFYDDLFIADPERLIELADILEEEGDLGTATYSCAVRADLLTEATAELLVRLGVESVTFGLESADDDTQKRLGKGLDAEQARRALALLERYDIECRVSAIIGEPDEPLESVRRTYSFLAEQSVRGRLAAAEVHVLSPFPGADYWELAKQRGLVGDLASFDWSRLGAPWRGLLLNRELERDARLVISWDAHVRRIFEALERPTIMLAPDDAELDLDADARLLRGIYLLAPGVQTAEMIEAGEVDLARFSLDELRPHLHELVERYGDAPLALFAPAPGDATIAAVRALKLALAIGKAEFARPRFGQFPLLANLARALDFDDDRIAALVAGDEAALPPDPIIAEPQRLRELPQLNLHDSPPFDGTIADLLDAYAGELAARRTRS
jgi:radical SAM superfamily enzyme YgiQ (UPF0313 family)